MLKDHPFGIGAGNWYQTIERYLPQYPRKDSHNTFVKCAGELGIQGIAVFLAIIANAFMILRRLRRKAEELPLPQRRDVQMMSFGLMISLLAYLVCCLPITLLYIEVLWWLLVLPVAFERVVWNIEADLKTGKPKVDAATDGLLESEVAASA